MEFSTVSIGEEIRKGLPLIEEGWRQIGEERFSFDEDGFIEAVNSGLVRVFTAHEGDRMVGYTLVIVSPNPFDTRRIEGIVLGMYVQPEARAGNTATEFARYIEARLCNDGVHYISQTAPAGTSINKWLQRMGYQEVETVYRKPLQEH